jgi:glycerol kinase
MMHRVILAADQGTTGTTCFVVDDELNVVGRGYAAVAVTTPRPGWVEQDPHELWASVERAAEAALADAGVGAAAVDALGIANQRETTLVWNRRTGEPVYPAIVWQDRRTAERCGELPAETIRLRTGLTPDPYFSATKLEWILRETDAPADEVAFGTVDTWLVSRLTGGAAHATDVTNASRTMLLDLATLDWSDELCELFGVPRSLLPRVHASAETIGEGRLLGATLPIAALAGDQQASLFAHGAAKATFGTGAFVLVETEAEPPHGLLRTAAARLEGEPARRALEGAVFVTGAALQWLRDGLGLIADTAESEALAESVSDTGGVYFVPALTGLGSPHWRAEVRGTVSGITRGTTRAHLVRAALEAAAYQTADVLAAMPPLESLRVDGGMTRNRWFVQFLADVLGIPVETAREPEQTALGAALLGLGKRQPSPVGERFEPARDVSELYAGWRDAVDRVLS